MPHNIAVAELISHPLSPLPWVLLSPERLSEKTNTGVMAIFLQKHITPAEKSA